MKVTLAVKMKTFLSFLGQTAPPAGGQRERSQPWSRGCPHSPSLSLIHTSTKRCVRCALLGVEDSITVASCCRDWVCVNFFPMFGQGKIREVFRYRTLKSNSLMFSLHPLCYREEDMRASIPAWAMTLAGGAWLGKWGALLACLQRRVHSTGWCPPGLPHAQGYLVQL